MTRLLPQRLSHDALGTLLTPSRPPSLSYMVSLSPQERLLGRVFLERDLPIIPLESSTPLPSTDPKVSSFKVEMLQFHLTFSNNLQSLHINIQPVPEQGDQLSMEVSNIIQQYLPGECPAVVLQNPRDSSWNP